ncbi:gephyrin-like molybdotransferase Glp [Microbacterium sp. P05]|uniref:molybdopterin molybdotransferase MoeA n=1 Tax=Microbacterium sp. P05 TaxID=3366948 RepID=UPI0037477F32
MSALRSVEEQLGRILATTRVLPAAAVPVISARGATLAEPILAAGDIPVFDNSAMDGFAVRFADVADAAPDAPVTLRVVADLPAGTPLDPPLAAGEAARIMTGSPVPTDADTIVPFEDTAAGLSGGLDDVVVVSAPHHEGVFVRRRGGDLRTGDEVMAPGTRLGPFQVAAAIAAGVTHVTVVRAPRVAVVSTGSELRGPDETGGAGSIPDSNGPLLAGLVVDADAEVVLAARVGDDPGEVLRVTRDAEAAGADVIVFTGGVSAGAFEPVRGAFEGGPIEFAKVAMQPGKPQAFGMLPSGALVFGLPGNPVSVAVSFEVFVRPTLLQLQGRAVITRPTMTLAAAVSWRTPPGRRQYLPAIVDPDAGTVRPATAGGSGSHLAGGLARAQAFAIVSADIDEVAVGDAVDVMLVS